MASTTDNSAMAGLIVEKIKRDFIPILRNKLVFDPYAKVGKLEMHGGSKTMRWNIMTDIGTFTTALGETTTTQNEISTITVSSVLMTVADYGAFVKISDLADSVWTKETRQEHSEIFAYSGAKTRDVLLRDVADDTTNYLIAGETAVNTGTVATTDTATAADLNAIRGFFNAGDADPFDSLGGNFVLMMPGEVEQDMVADVTTLKLSWSNIHMQTNPAVNSLLNYKGPGALLGVAVLRTNNIGQVALTVSTTPASATGTVTAYKCIALAEYGIGKTTLDQADPRIIMKRPNSGTVSVPLDTHGTIGWKMRQAQGLLDVARALVYYAAK